MRTLQRLAFRDLKLVYTDGSSKLHDTEAYHGGFGVFVENELNLSLYNPRLLGQADEAAELLAVQTRSPCSATETMPLSQTLLGFSEGPQAGPASGERGGGWPTRAHYHIPNYLRRHKLPTL